MNINGVGLEVIGVGAQVQGGVVEDQGGGEVVIGAKDGFGICGYRGNGEEEIIDGEGVGAYWLW